MIGLDFQRYVNNGLEKDVNEHLEVSKERYKEKSAQEAAIDFAANYDHDAQISHIEEILGRTLSSHEKVMYYREFVKQMENSYKEKQLT